MKRISESKALAKLEVVRSEFVDEIRSRYEHRAKPCTTCKTPGACCLDEHFVNVRITKLEAAAIRRRLTELPLDLQKKVGERTEAAIEKYGLDRADKFGTKTYSCPLFEKGIGCLVHDHAKPLPCIAHACYDRKEDLPPDELLNERETKIFELNRRTYGESWITSIPVAISKQE